MRYPKLGAVLGGLAVVSLASLLANPFPFAQVRGSAEKGRAGVQSAQKTETLPNRVPRTRNFLTAAFIGNFGTVSHGAGFVSSLTITNNGTTTGVAAGDSIIVALSTGSSGATGAVTCADTKGNVYNIDIDLPVSSTSPRLTICSAHGVTALTAADTITVTFPSNGNTQQASASEFSGLTPVGTLDQTHPGTGSSISPDSGNTAPTSQADELLFGAVRFSGTNNSMFTAPSAGFTLTNTPIGGGGTPGLASEFEVVSAVGAYSAGGTLSVTNPWQAEIATYRIAQATTPSPSSTPTNTPTSTPTSTATNTPTSTPTNTPTKTPTNTPTNTPSNTPTNTPSNTPTNTPTNTQTPAGVATDTPTKTPTSTPTNTPTNTPSNTPSSTPSNTPTNTPSNTPSNTPTVTGSVTNTPTNTPTNTSTNTPTNTSTNTPTNTPVASTPTVTATPGGGNIPNNIPTVSDWGLLAFGLLLAGLGYTLLRAGSSRV